MGIESLLAPLTPLPDLEQVPKVRGGSASRLKKAGEGAEESRTGSFELVRQEEEEEDWNLVQSCEIGIAREERERKKTKEGKSKKRLGKKQALKMALKVTQ